MSIKVLLVVVSVGVLIGALPQAEQKHHHLRVDLDEHWTTFKKSFGKEYDNDLEESYRRAVWQDNLDYIQKHNIEADLGLHSYTLGVNQFADLTTSEFSKLFLGTRVPPSFNATYDDYYRLFDGVDSNLPASVDWRTQGYVTPVKNQGSCGSCWAFSSTGSLEGQTFKKYKRLTPLSEQNLVDCTRNYGNYGCNGGWMANAFNYIRNNRGIDTGASYPYEGRDNVCRFRTSGIGATLTGYVSVPRSESSLQQAVANVGPISVAIDAGHSSFQFYKSGVYNEPACTSAVDHAVLVVGYGTYAGKDYWLVKNSWSTSWGNAGYIWMSRNRGNQCSIASYAIYPVV